MTASRKYILLTDLDSTAVAFQKLDPATFSKFFPKRLSPQFLTFMQRNLAQDADAPPTFYSGFYVCTHRALCSYSDPLRFTYAFDDFNRYNKILFGMIEKIDKEIPHLTPQEVEKKNERKAEINKFLEQSGDCSEAHPDEDFTFRIVANLKDATKMECFAVSTPEDDGAECGVGYEAILKPYELYVMENKTVREMRREDSDEMMSRICYPSSDDCKISYSKRPITSFDPNTKNEQIFSIVEHIKKQKDFDLKKTYILDFADDKDAIRKAALAIYPTSLPANMILRVFKANAEACEDLRLVGEVHGIKPLIQTTPSPSVANFSILGRWMSIRKRHINGSMSESNTAEKNHGMSSSR